MSSLSAGGPYETVSEYKYVQNTIWIIGFAYKYYLIITINYKIIYI